MNFLLNFKKILVTSGFVYSNGSLHLGHMLENIQADIFVRYNKFIGNIVYFISSDDSHGTPIMMKSYNKKINILKLIKSVYKDHKKIFKLYNINFNFYSTTNNKINNNFLLKIFKILNKKKLVFKKIVKQFYDTKKLIFLSDRMIIGSCPRCKSKNQYGDNCNKCNYNYDSINVINPISKISNTIPIIKKSKHFFLNLNMHRREIFNSINNRIILQKPIIKKSLEWFNKNKNLKSWNISRDYPYFGFKIPKCKNKYFYVWLDAITGYISTFKNFCILKKIDYLNFWNKNSDTKLYQFIGKDIIYFHVIFWPYILNSINFRNPNKIIVHGHLKVKNNKMSKSINNIINAKIFSKNINTDYIRYYFASKLSYKINDINFNNNEFKKIINNTLINKIINLASRCSNLINLKCNNIISNKLINKSPYNYFINLSEHIWYNYETFDYKKVIFITNKLSDISNKYISDKEPWKFNNKEDIKNVCSIGIYLFKIIIIYLKPIIPKIARFSEKFLNCYLNKKSLYETFKENHKINNFNIIFKKI